MITLFAIPKPYTGSAALAQRNALETWTRLGPAVEIVLLGGDEGVAEAAAAADEQQELRRAAYFDEHAAPGPVARYVLSQAKPD